MPSGSERTILHAVLLDVLGLGVLLRARGHHAARALADRLEETLRRQNALAAPEEDEDEDQLEPGGAA